MRSRALLALQRLILRSARSPLRPLWRLFYRAVEFAGAAYLVHGERRAAVYARSAGVDSSDFLPGLSDVDLVVVAARDDAGPGVAEARIKRRWARLSTPVPWISLVLDHPRVHEQEDLDSIAGTSILDHGLDAETPPDNVFLGARANFDTQRALLRPGMFGAFHGWRRVRGPDRRPAVEQPDPLARRTAAWLELTYMWRLAVTSCMDPGTPRSADVCLKLVAECARCWLGAAHGTLTGDRGETLEAALALMPEEEPGLRRALALRRELPTVRVAPWEELLPTALRITARVAALLAEDGEGETRRVRLAGASDDPGLMPLVDWRILADPVVAEERFFVLGESPGDPAALRAAAGAHPEGPFPVMFEHGVMVLPSRALVRAWRSTIQCPVSDPVSFALAAGRDVAEFSGAPGWRAGDIARRAVIEHRAWLRAPAGSWRGSPEEAGGRTTEMLFTAARAALFLSSVEEGEPELCLTVAEIARRLDAGDETTAALRKAVEALPAYAEPSASTRSRTAGRSAIT